MKILLAGLLALCANGQTKTYRFDFGPKGSEVAAGYTLVTPEAVYSKSRGYGFLTVPAEAGVIDKNLTIVDERFKEPWRVETGVAGLNALTRDFVAGPEIRFRADLPNGKYDVVATIGYKHGIHHLNVAANGRETAN